WSKNKKWEEDALLLVKPSSRLAILKSLDGSTELSRGSGMKMAELSNIEVGVTEIQILEEILDSKASEPKPAVSGTNKIMNRRIQRVGKPLVRPIHDEVPLFVMPRPPPEVILSEGAIQDVSVDPRLAKVLRSHQKEGVLFMYKCLMGYRTPGYHGVILADEMGLGKTLQTISLVYTLLKQSPISGESSTVQRCLILAPSSLLGNWKEEFNKWLGPERLRVFVGESSSLKITEYIKYPNEPVVILSYEMFVRCFDELSRLKFQLLIADEGHRLKNSSIKASTLIQTMEGTTKRILLTGTPVQNDLKEFYALISLVNPSILGSSVDFVRNFETPIVRSKQPNSSEEEIQEGNYRMEELSKVTEKFILRRTQDVISSFLPSKTDNVLFCAPSPLQRELYEKALDD
ncbi:DNA repair and recombination protein RAD54Blike, partial [Caligus rogercresseyi]